MARVFRLIFAALLLVAGPAHALFPKVYGYKTNWAPTVIVDTPQRACEVALPKYNQTADPGMKAASVTAGPGTSEGSCAAVLVSGGNTNIGGWLRVTGHCPVNSAVVTGGCQCNAGYEEDPTKTSCVPSKSRWEKACEANMGKRIDFLVDGRALPGGCLTGINNVNSPIEGETGGLPESFGCSMRFVDGEQISALDPDSKSWVTRGLARVTGGTCVATGSGGIPNDAPPDTEETDEGKKNPCPWGLVKALNGQIVCAYDDPNGTIEGTETTGKKNPDGTTTETKKETKCEGGRCTTKTTETTKDANGTVIGIKVDEKEQSIGGKCNEDPGSKVCTTTGNGDGEGGAGFSGSCESGFVVKSDDPIANAMALEQHRRNCQFFEKKPDATDETRAYDAMLEKGKQGGDQTGDLPEGSKRDYTIGPGSFDYSSAIGSQQCFRDRNVSIWGRSIAIPLSVVCPWLEILGNILVVVGSLLAARIVVRG